MSFGFDVCANAPYVNVNGADIKQHFDVTLPHQCEEWTIAYAPDRETAIADLERFIREAQAALEELRTIEPTVPPWASQKTENTPQPKG